MDLLSGNHLNDEHVAKLKTTRRVTGSAHRHSADLADQELYAAEAKRVRITSKRLTVELRDGREISVPMAWFPRLVHAKPRDRRRVEISGFGMHWPDLDEDINVRSLLLGRRSGESRRSFKFWLDAYKRGKLVTLEDFATYRRSTRKHAKDVRSLP